MLGEAQPFYEQVTIYYQSEFTPFEDLDFEHFAEELTTKATNPKLFKEPLYCFYKGFALYFDNQRTVAYHFNRQQQQATTLGKNAVTNRVKMAIKREQQGVLTFEATGKKVCLDNNTGWKTYWQFAEKVLNSNQFELINNGSNVNIL